MDIHLIFNRTYNYSGPGDRKYVQLGLLEQYHHCVNIWSTPPSRVISGEEHPQCDIWWRSPTKVISSQHHPPPPSDIHITNQSDIWLTSPSTDWYLVKVTNQSGICWRSTTEWYLVNILTLTLWASVHHLQVVTHHLLSKRKKRIFKIYCQTQQECLRKWITSCPT